MLNDIKYDQYTSYQTLSSDELTRTHPELDILCESLKHHVRRATFPRLQIIRAAV